MKVLFTFYFDTETQEAGMTVNIPAQQAAVMLQQLAITDAVNRAKSDNGNKEEANATTGLPQPSTD